MASEIIGIVRFLPKNVPIELELSEQQCLLLGRPLDVYVVPYLGKHVWPSSAAEILPYERKTMTCRRVALPLRTSASVCSIVLCFFISRQ